MNPLNFAHPSRTPSYAHLTSKQPDEFVGEKHRLSM
jgi:hypothetical protein